MPARREGNSIYLLYRGLRLRKQCRGLSYAQVGDPNCWLLHCTARRSKRRHFVELQAKRSCQEVVSGWRCADELMCSMSEMGGQSRHFDLAPPTTEGPAVGTDVGATRPSLKAFGRRPRSKPHRRDRPASETLNTTGLMHYSKHQAGSSPRSFSGTCLSSALFTNSTASIAAPSWVRNCSIDSFIGAGRSPHQSIT